MAPQGKAAASAAACASDAFPSGLYGKYKRATDFFLDWLLRARSAGDGAPLKTTKGNGKKDAKPTLSLEVYEKIVVGIAQEPTRLALELQQLWVRALAACETAIALRARVALFFATSAEGADSHAHFVERLRSWLAMLQQAKWPNASAYVDLKQDAVDFDNYFTALELPDDYFSQESDFAKSTTRIMTNDTAMGGSKRRNKHLCDETGDDELKVELSFFFMELEELLEAVHNAFLDVKHQTKTLFEATVITKVAVDCAGKVIARLELRYPWISSCDDILNVLDDVVLSPGFKMLWDAVLTGWSTSPSQDGNQPTEEGTRVKHPEYVPGAIVVDFVWVSTILRGFVAAIPSFNQRKSVAFKECDAPYDEDQTPHYVWPTMDAHEPYFGPQLRALYDELIAKDIKDTEPRTLGNWFMSFFERVVSTRTATLSCAFLVICWARAAAVLQGDGRLHDTVRLSIMRCWDLEERMRAIMVNPLNVHIHSQTEVDNCLAALRRINESISLLQANPLLAGCSEIDHLATAQNYGTAMCFTTYRLRTFAHCYHAMVESKSLDPIPVIEDILREYEHTIFRPSRRAVVHGSYITSYFASLVKQDPVQSAYGRFKNRRVKVLSDQDEHGFSVVSRVMRLLYSNDYSFVQTQSPSMGSWRNLISSVTDACSEELFGTRLLSRDISTLTNEMTVAFHAVVGVMDPSFKGTQLFSSQKAFLTDQETVIFALMAMMDRSNRKAGSFGVKMKLFSVDPGMDVVQAYYHRAADVVSRHFAEYKPDVADAKFFVYPPRPGSTKDERSGKALESPTPEQTAAKFGSLIEMLKRSQGPLSDEKIDQLKEAVAKDLALLRMSDTSRELCTLLHHAAAGPAHDHRLLKWLVQVDAFQRGKTISFMPAQDSSEARQPNMTALHCAAKAGLVEMVRVLLKAGLMRDVNTVTAHTRETLAHLAVKHGHRKLLRYLISVNADLWQPDAEGNSVHQLLTAKQWRIQIGCQLPQDEANSTTVESRSREEAAEYLRHSLVRYCDEKRAAQATLSESSEGSSVDREVDKSSSGKAKSKRSKKKRKSTKASEPSTFMTPSACATAMGFIQQHFS